MNLRIRRIVVIALLSLGVVGGYGSGIYGVTHHQCSSGGGCQSWHKWHEQHDDSDDAKK